MCPRVVALDVLAANALVDALAVAEPAKCHELKTLITLVFADYAYKPLGIRFLERLYEKASSVSQPSRHA